MSIGLFCIRDSSECDNTNRPLVNLPWYGNKPARYTRSTFEFATFEVYTVEYGKGCPMVNNI
jgi:hypothetical protein